MTAQEQELWSQINVLAETDIMASHVVQSFRANWIQGRLSQQEMLLSMLLTTLQVIASQRAQLIEAENIRPRVYYLNKGQLDG